MCTHFWKRSAATSRDQTGAQPTDWESTSPTCRQLPESNSTRGRAIESRRLRSENRQNPQTSRILNIIDSPMRLLYKRITLRIARPTHSNFL